MDAVTDSAGGSAEKSLRRRPQELGLSRASLQIILKKDLQLYPYRIQIKHKLSPVHMEFLVSVMNHYHSELHLFWDTLQLVVLDIVELTKFTGIYGGFLINYFII